MSDDAVILDQILEEIGLTVTWEAKGEEKGKLKVAGNLISMGMSFERIAEATGLDIEVVKSINNHRKLTMSS